MPMSTDGLDTLLTITDKFSKRRTFIAGKSTDTAAIWGKALAVRLMEGDWGFPSQIISDRDRKFVSELWRGLFKVVKTTLLFSTVWHSQTDGQSEITNQITEIMLRYLLLGLHDARHWSSVLPALQSYLNSVYTAPIDSSPHEVMYGMKLSNELSLLTADARGFQDWHCRMDAVELIKLGAMDPNAQQILEISLFDDGSNCTSDNDFPICSRGR